MHNNCIECEKDKGKNIIDVELNNMPLPIICSFKDCKKLAAQKCKCGFNHCSDHLSKCDRVEAEG